MTQREPSATPPDARPAPRASDHARVLAFPLVLAAIDLALRARTKGNANPHHWSLQDGAVYALGLGWSFASWLLFAAVVSHLTRGRGAARALVAFAMGSLGGLLFMLSFTYRATFDQSPSWQVLKWGLAEWRSVVQLARWQLNAGHAIVIPLVGAALVLAMPRTRAALAWPRSMARRLAATLALGAYVATSVLTLGVAGFQDPLPVDANSMAAVVQLGIAATTHEMHLVAPVRPVLAPAPPAHRPNVLLLVHESLRADGQLPGLDYPTVLDAHALAPFASTLPARRAEGYFVFPRARTNSTATESSVPTILAGIDPGGPALAFGRATSYFALGKATQAHTFLYSAQSYSFSHFDEFFFDTSLDVQKTGEDLSAVLVNDRGIDDAFAVDAAIAHLAELARSGTRFVGAVHFNATHAPGYPGPGVAFTPKDREDPGQYELAARYIDRQVERLLRALDDLGLAQSTVVASTSDHGEIIGPHHPVDRLGNFYEEVLRIPVWVRVPPAWMAEQPGWAQALDAWHDRNVQNLDVLPTLRDVLALGGDPALGPSELRGRSLVRPPPADDVIAGQSTCAYRQWALDGLYAINGRVKVIASNDRASAQVYDLDADPREEHDLWGEPGWRERVMPWLTRVVLAGEERRAACARAKSACPVDVGAAHAGAR